ncbi:MAG: hypothetical protein RMI78_03975, partial [Nitrososphaerota archaeon]|nr:hypothetical protein [Nitrososphaerota archaeon]
VIAIAVAFWATGLVGVFTRFEKIEITSVYAKASSSGGYDITIRAKNTGSSSATIDQVLINGVVVCAGSNLAPTTDVPPGFKGSITCSIQGEGDLALDTGEEVIIIVSAGGAPAGVTVEVGLHSASGKLYPYSVLLP